MIDQDKSHSVISSSIYAIKWVHNLNDLSDPTESGMVKQLLEASKRLRSKPVQKKKMLLIQKYSYLYVMSIRILQISLN